MPLLSRREIFDAVWSRPVKEVAAELNLSGNRLKTLCERALIPVPPRGYWEKVAAGKPVVKPPLPPRSPGMPLTIQIGPSPNETWPPDPVAVLAKPEPAAPDFGEPVEAMEQRIRTAVGTVKLIRNFDRPHPEIRKLLDKDEKRRASARSDGLVFPWNKLRFDAPFEQRRLKLLNTLLVHLQAHGGKAWVQGDAARGLGVRIGGVHLSFDLDHPGVKPFQYGEGKVREGPNDKLRLAIYDPEHPHAPRVWHDTEAAPLESRLTELIIGMMMMAETVYRHVCIDSYRSAMKQRAEMSARLDREKAEADATARQRLADEARRRRDVLIAQMQAWRMAGDLRSFVVAVERQAEPTPILAVWADWARAVADEIDPLLSSAGLSLSDPSIRRGD